jgi:prepilin-type N-terminal cleavage/methylation domain-containing protein
MQHKRGFTLAEVIIVIAIIAILGAITFSTFGPAREKGRQTVCMSNLKNIYQALMMYGADYEGHDHLPGLENIPLEPFLMPTMLLPYTGTNEILFCPDTPAEKRKTFMSTYNWVLYPRMLEEKGDEMAQRQIRKQRLLVAEQGSAATILRCYNHEVAYYEAQQADTDPSFRKKFVIDLNAAGGVKARLLGLGE